MPALNTLVVLVAYRSPILIAAFFARPTALCAPQCVERSDPIARTEATRGPRRLKWLVMGTQGEGDRPAAGSRRRSLGKKYRTTNILLCHGERDKVNELSSMSSREHPLLTRG